MKPLSVLAYFDGRPGHEKQTQGILDALAGMTPIKIDSVKVPLSPATYLKDLTIYFLPFLQGIAQRNDFQPVDLVIGTGSHTHLPMLLQKKRQHKSSGKQARLVTCMTPDKYLLSRFDLCFIPMHDQPALVDNVFITQGPPNTVRHGGDQYSDRGLILVGGIDTKSHIWHSSAIIGMIRMIVDKQPGISWTVSSSPRTPEETCNSLAELAGSMQNVKFFRSEDTPAGWVEEQYNLNRSVWVTADSVSMVYEALTAGCSVGVLPVEWLRQDNKFLRSLRNLTGNSLVVDFHDWQQGTPMPMLKDKPVNESRRCAEEILRRWWPDRLP
jgi:mitochondrial fission protein ELM1